MYTIQNEKVKQTLIDIYLDWLNNYLTIEKMSQDYRLDESDMSYLISIGKKLFNQ